MTEATLRTYPDLSAAALRLKLDLPYRLWLLLRPAFDGRGRLALADVYALSCSNRRQTRAWLRQGEGVFWTREGGCYRLTGLKNLADVLDAPPCRRSVNVPRANLENLAKFRASLYASWFADRPRTISQRRLGEIFGRSDRTLRAWAHLAGLEVGTNLAWAPLPDDGDDLSKYPPGVMRAMGIKTAEEETTKPNNVWVEHWDALPGEPGWKNQNYCKGGKPVLVWRLPNTYRADLERGPMTRLQRAAVRALLRSSESRANARLFHERGKGQANKAARALERDPHVAFLEEGTTHYGYGLWSFNAV